MKVALVFFNDFQHGERPQELLQRLFTITDWVEALHSVGVEVLVFLRFFKKATIEKESGLFYFIQGNLGEKLSRRQLPFKYCKQIRYLLQKQQVQIVHAHDLNAIFANRLLRFFTPSFIPMLVQDHGSIPLEKGAFFQKWVFKSFQAFMFAAPGQEKVWIKTNRIGKRQKCFFVMENATHFRYQSRITARQETELSGNPAFLWVGNLTANKDPMTVLTAFLDLLNHLPEAQLYMIYQIKDLEQTIKAFLNKYPRLLKRVHLLGSKARSEMQSFFNSSDYFILGSHKEGSGYALIESLACGVIPIVTDIPSFKVLTGNGSIGILWKPGDADALKKAIIKITGKPMLEESKKVLNHYEANFSFNTMAKQAKTVYQSML